MKTNAVLHHHPEAVDTVGAKRLMGRHSAGEGFLKGFVRHADVDRFYCHATKADHFHDFQRRVAAFRGRDDKPTEWISPKTMMRTHRPGCLVVPGPGIDDYSWQRRHHDPRGYSLCGLTHTIASARVMNSLGALLTAPVQPWDAVVCTSRAVKVSVERVIEDYADYLRQRIGAKPRQPVQLPIIPLGVDCSAFEDTEKTRPLRAEWRNKLKIADDSVVVLFLGRLSFHAKAHPMPMYLALQMATRRSGKKIHLIQAGEFSNKDIEREFRETAKEFCPEVDAIFVDGRSAEVRAGVWRAADIFTSLSDNIQESFGLTPIEAKAAGLPLVVTDWDGYRDTVRNGIDGITIPTRMPKAPFGEEIAFGHLSEMVSYDRYVGQVSQCTSVDIDAAADAFAQLCGDAALRRRMGDSGRTHAKENFDWSVVVAAYQNLWDELERLRRDGKEVAARKANQPADPLWNDPFAVFSSYPTAPLTERDRVAAASDSAIEQLSRFYRFGMNTFASDYLLSREMTEAVLRALIAYGPSTVGDLTRMVPQERRADTVRTVAWLGKMGLIRLNGDSATAAGADATPAEAAE